jgi:glycosyltransferase involved in cell wall biosynthesis
MIYRRYMLKQSAFYSHQKQKGFPNVLAEACSFGLPIITTNAGDASVILKDYPNADIATTEKHFSEILNNFDKNDFTHER